MKKNIIIVAIFLALSVYKAEAQVSVQFNLGIQPLWGPVGYDYVEYYYLPDIDVYYDVPRQEYVYFNGGTWVYARTLPPAYARYDLYRVHKVVINEPNPWRRHDYYRNQYVRYKGHYDQRVIRDSRSEKYWANPSHPKHGNWHDNGNGRGYEKHQEWQGYKEHGNGHDNGHGHGNGNGHGHKGR